MSTKRTAGLAVRLCIGIVALIPISAHPAPVSANTETNFVCPPESPIPWFCPNPAISKHSLNPILSYYGERMGKIAFVVFAALRSTIGRMLAADLP